jgi:hypothetical protein
MILRKRTHYDAKLVRIRRVLEEELVGGTEESSSDMSTSCTHENLVESKQSDEMQRKSVEHT